MSFESIFGIPAEKFIVHLINPVVFMQFVFSKEDLDDNNVILYKKRVKICLLALAGWLVDDNNVILYKKRVKICLLALAGWLVVFILFRIIF
jgi:hypothetical protein